MHYVEFFSIAAEKSTLCEEMVLLINKQLTKKKGNKRALFKFSPYKFKYEEKNHNHGKSTSKQFKTSGHTFYARLIQMFKHKQANRKTYLFPHVKNINFSCPQHYLTCPKSLDHNFFFCQNVPEDGEKLATLPIFWDMF